MNFWQDAGIWISKLILTKGARWMIKISSALGIGFASYAFILQPILDFAISQWQNMPGSIAGWLHTLGVDVAISIILSACGFKGVERIVFARRPQP